MHFWSIYVIFISNVCLGETPIEDNFLLYGLLSFPFPCLSLIDLIHLVIELRLWGKLFYACVL